MNNKITLPTLAEYQAISFNLDRETRISLEKAIVCAKRESHDCDFLDDLIVNSLRGDEYYKNLVKDTKFTEDEQIQLHEYEEIVLNKKYYLYEIVYLAIKRTGKRPKSTISKEHLPQSLEFLMWEPSLSQEFFKLLKIIYFGIGSESEQLERAIEHEFRNRKTRENEI